MLPSSTQLIPLTKDISIGPLLFQGGTSLLYKGLAKKAKGDILIKMTPIEIDKKHLDKKLIDRLNSTKKTPKIIWTGKAAIEKQRLFVEVMEMSGPNLKTLFQMMDKNFGIPTIASLAYQMICTIEIIHKHRLIHRYIKPSKFLSPLDSLSLNIIDFKYAEILKCSDRADFYKENIRLPKNQINKFSSIGVHYGLTASPRDDLESIGYILIYFLTKGNFLRLTSEQKANEKKNKVYEKLKLGLTPEKYFQTYSVPQEFLVYLNYVKNLGIKDEPEYEFLKKQFKTLFNKMHKGASESFKYDWALKFNIKPATKKANELKSENSLSEGSAGSTQSGNSPDMNKSPTATPDLALALRKGKSQKESLPELDHRKEFIEPENVLDDENAEDELESMMLNIKSLDEEIKIPFYNTQT